MRIARSASVLLGACIGTWIQPHAAIADTMDATVLGALSDDPPLNLTVNGTPVYVYQFARNGLLRQSGHFRDVTYYYAAKPHLKHGSDGVAVVTAYPSLTGTGRETVELSVDPAPVSASDVCDALRAQGVDAYVQPAHVLNLTVYSIDAKIADLPVTTIVQGNATPFSDTVSFSWNVPAGTGAKLRTALAAGASVQVGYETLVKTSQLENTKISWADVKTTKAFRDYSGPSGPKLLTAAQVANLTSSIFGELKVHEWREKAAGSSGGASAADYGKNFDAIVDRMVKRRERKEASLETWGDAMRLAVPVDRWQKLVDETRTIAWDAKNLDDNEWCNKYRGEMETLAERRSEGSSDTSFGLNIIVPDVDVPLGLNFGDKGSDTDFSKDYTKSLLATENCGKNIVERNFNYDFKGVRYEPKSIYVYERLTSAVDISDSEEYTTYTITQRMGRNVWSVQ